MRGGVLVTVLLGLLQCGLQFTLGGLPFLAFFQCTLPMLSSSLCLSPEPPWPTVSPPLVQICLPAQTDQPVLHPFNNKLPKFDLSFTSCVSHLSGPCLLCRLLSCRPAFQLLHKRDLSLTQCILLCFTQTLRLLHEWRCLVLRGAVQCGRGRCEKSSFGSFKNRSSWASRRHCTCCTSGAALSCVVQCSVGSL